MEVVSLTYPLFDFGAIASTLRALAWIKAERGQSSVSVVGESAGSVLASVAAALCANPKALAEFCASTGAPPDVVRLDLPRVDALACWSGIMDSDAWRGKGRLSFLLEFSCKVFAGEHPASRKVLPRRFRTLHDVLELCQQLPPVLMCVGEQDELGLLASNVLVFEQLRAKGFACELQTWPLRGHGIFGWVLFAPPCLAPPPANPCACAHARPGRRW
jgi:acetyl esterase/lipase